MPPLPERNLRDCQIDAVTGLEASLAQNKPRALVQMATGAGKTFTAITSSLPPAQVRRRQAHPVPRRHAQPRRAGAPGVHGVHAAGRRPQVHRAVQRAAPGIGHIDPHAQVVHQHHPAHVLHPHGRADRRVRRRQPRSTRSQQTAKQDKLRPSTTRPSRSRSSTSSSSTNATARIYNLWQAGARVLRRLPDRPDRHARQAHLRLLQREHRRANTPTSSRWPTASTSATRSTRSKPRSPRRAPSSRPSEWVDHRDRQTRKKRWERDRGRHALHRQGARPLGGQHRARSAP